MTTQKRPASAPRRAPTVTTTPTPALQTVHGPHNGLADGRDVRPNRSHQTSTDQRTRLPTALPAGATKRGARSTKERYLSIPQVAEILGTTERFPRRLIEERRIEFQRFGRHVRIAESVLTAYIESCTVEPVRRSRRVRSVA
ncbi:hypothetical protein GCM10020369_32930 [Cryptosporangium minutisporangium]|uniref:Helix-turn-helix domain-containing protein n=1 Tax=Cryptosporangium minutisporangium TaxID=113569 RepID=A0ABP6SXT1_9ACTN